jgi:hypothetical protein
MSLEIPEQSAFLPSVGHKGERRAYGEPEPVNLDAANELNALDMEDERELVQGSDAFKKGNPAAWARTVQRAIDDAARLLVDSDAFHDENPSRWQRAVNRANAARLLETDARDFFRGNPQAWGVAVQWEKALAEYSHPRGVVRSEVPEPDGLAGVARKSRPDDTHGPKALPTALQENESSTTAILGLMGRGVPRTDIAEHFTAEEIEAAEREQARQTIQYSE